MRGIGDSQPKRCPWVNESNPLYVAYHDKEWGVPVYEDRTHFEFLILESAQAGLSWETVLKRREGYRQAFADFDPEVVASYTEQDVARLLNDQTIIRNKLKILAAINNAQAFLQIQDTFGSFSAYIWSFVGYQPLIHAFWKLSDYSATSPESEALSWDMKQKGFGFVGPTILYAHMQATGLVHDHVVDCFRYKVFE